MDFNEVIKATGLAVKKVDVPGIGEVDIYPFSGKTFEKMATREDEKTDFHYAAYALKGKPPTKKEEEQLKEAITVDQATKIVRAAVGIEDIEQAGKS